jgi:hypothetical protein
MWHWILYHLGVTNPINQWYNFWSGFGSDLGELLILGGIIQFFKHHNCHVQGCWRVKTSNDPTIHAPACRKHHTLGYLHGKDPNA